MKEVNHMSHDSWMVYRFEPETSTIDSCHLFAHLDGGELKKKKENTTQIISLYIELIINFEIKHKKKLLGSRIRLMQ